MQMKSARARGAGQRAGQAGVRAEPPPWRPSRLETTGFIQWASGLQIVVMPCVVAGRARTSRRTAAESDLAARRRGKTYLTDPYIEMTPEVSTDSSI